MNRRIYNFSAGPSTLPVAALEATREALFNFAGTGIGIMEISHRSEAFAEYLEGVEADLRALLAIPQGYTVLFLQGGASSQFFMIPMNLLPAGTTATILDTGVWSHRAIAEAALFGNIHVGFDGEKHQFRRVPQNGEFSVAADSVYLYYTANNTIYGTQFHTVPDAAPMLVCDMSSEFLSRPVDVSRYGLIHAGAQKNLGPAGVTLVIIRDDLLAKRDREIPTMLRYSTHAGCGSMYNTPPVVNIFVVGEVLKVLKQRGLAGIDRANRAKAALLYEVIDASDGYYRGHAAEDSRSMMNVTFNLPTPALEKKFVAEALAAEMSGLKGHRHVGGCRASIYNAFPEKGVARLAQFMNDFARKNPQ